MWLWGRLAHSNSTSKLCEPVLQWFLRICNMTLNALVTCWSNSVTEITRWGCLPVLNYILILGNCAPSDCKPHSLYQACLYAHQYCAKTSSPVHKHFLKFEIWIVNFIQIVHWAYCMCDSITAVQLRTLILQVNND